MSFGIRCFHFPPRGTNDQFQIFSPSRRGFFFAMRTVTILGKDIHNKISHVSDFHSKWFVVNTIPFAVKSYVSFQRLLSRALKLNPNQTTWMESMTGIPIRITKTQEDRFVFQFGELITFFDEPLLKAALKALPKIKHEYQPTKN